MKNIKSFCFILFIGGIFFSCDSKPKYTYEAKIDSLITAIVNTKEISCGTDTILYFIGDSLGRKGIILKRSDCIPVRVLYKSEDKNKINGHIFIDGVNFKPDSLTAHIDFEYTDFCCDAVSNATYMFNPDSCTWKNIQSETTYPRIQWSNPRFCDSLYGQTQTFTLEELEKIIPEPQVKKFKK